MRQALLVVMVVAACVQPQPQPSYFSGQQQQQQPYAQPQPQPVAAATCQQTLECYGRCNPLTDQCVGACDQGTTPDSVQNAHALLQCMGQSGCADQSCVAQRCGAQITACTNVTVAAAPAPGPAAAPPPAPNGPDEVMTPEYYVGGTIKVPRPRRLLTQADLAGEWSADSSGGKWYYTSRGEYAGFSALSTADHWVIDAQGNYKEDFKAGYASSGGARGFEEHVTGRISIANNIVTIDMPAQGGLGADRSQYIVDGWFVGPQVIILKIQGPFHNAITQQDLDNVQSMSYRDKQLVKKR